jgi:hypothetical protein
LFALPVWGFLATFAAVLGGARAYSVLRMRRWRQGMAQAFEQLEDGQFDAAEQSFREVALSQTDPVLRSASADFGYLAVRRGDFDTALAIYSRAWRSPGLTPQARGAISLNLSFCYAAIGELEAAQKWYPGEDAHGTPSSAALILARLGRHQEVLELSMPELEPWQEVFVRHERRLLYLMRAFSLAAIGEPEDLVTAHGAVAQPAFAGEYDYVSTHWPELKEFVKLHVEPAAETP